MKRKVLLLLFTAFLAGTVSAALADEFLLGFTGFDYQSPDTSTVIDPVNHTDYLAFDEGYRSVGFVTSFGPLLTGYVDTDQNEYTYFLFSLQVNFHSYDSGT